MDISAIEIAVDLSISSERSLQAEMPAARFEDLITRFLRKRITPAQRAILLDWRDSFHPDVAGETKLVYFLTDCDPQSVIFYPETGNFGVAWGPDADTGMYFDDCSTDKSVLLAEFLCE